MSSSHSYRSLKQTAGWTSCPRTTIVVCDSKQSYIWVTSVEWCQKKEMHREIQDRMNQYSEIWAPVLNPLKGTAVNSADLNQTPQNVVSDQGLHSLLKIYSKLYETNKTIINEIPLK